mgnify:CR=1 FL=1
MPDVFRFYFKHAALGFAVAAIFIRALQYFNNANLWHLISGSDIGIMALAVFWILMGSVFGGVQFGIAVMMMEEKDDDGSGDGGAAAADFVPVKAVASRSH